jgi:hypothetical protein
LIIDDFDNEVPNMFCMFIPEAEPRSAANKYNAT